MSASTGPAGRGSPLETATDVVAVVVLSAVALLGLGNSFSGQGYLVTGLVAVVSVTAWSLVCTVQRYPAGAYLLVLSLGFPVLGATVAMHNGDLLGFPAPHAMGELLAATITAPGQFLTTIPPVDSNSTVLAIPYVVGYVLCGPSSWLALRSRRPLLPAVPLVLAMVGCIVLGTERPHALVARAGVFAGVLLLWVASRAGRGRAVTAGGRGRSLRAVAGTVTAVGAVVLATAWLPGVPHQDRAVLRGRIGSGQDVSQLDNPLASFRKYTRQPAGTADNVADKRLLHVSGLPGQDLLRFVALDVYDGDEWVAGNRTVADDNSALFQRIGTRVGAPLPGRVVHVAVEVERPWTSSWLPLSGQLTGISFDYLDGHAQRGDVRYDVATRTGMVVGGLQYRDDYHFTARVPDATLGRSMRPYGGGRPLQPTGAFLDHDLRPWRTSELTPVQQVFSLARYLRQNGRYSDGGSRLERGYLPGSSPQRLGPGFFTAHTIVGDDEQYAAFMALAANRLGVPARVVVGAVPDRQGWVRGRNVSAWVELRVADGSWRVLPTARFMTHRPPDGVVATPPQRYVKQSTARDRAQPPRGERPRSASSANQGPTHPARSPAAWALVLVLVLVLLLAVGVPAAKGLRRRRRRRRQPVHARFVGGWDEVLDLVRDLGGEVPGSLARTEQARRLGISLSVARAADDAVFAREQPVADDAVTFWVSIDQERHRLALEAGLLRRTWSWWAPTSLVRELGRATRRAAGRRRRGGLAGRSRRAPRPAPGG